MENVFFKLRNLALLCIAISFFGNSLHAESTGSWLMLFNQTRISNQWGIQADFQNRNYTVQQNWEQHLARLGLNYYLTDNATATIGYARISNYASSSEFLKNFSSSENRMWEQISIKQNSMPIKLEHRFRLEQRWLKSPTGNQYKNRFRYLFRSTYFVTHKEQKKNALFISCYDELFLNLNSKLFDRNRAYAALGFQWNKTANLQVGYLFQSTSEKTRGYIQVALFCNFDFRKSKTE